MTAGERLRARLTGALPAGSEWDEREAEIVERCVAQADDIEVLEILLREQGAVVKGSMGQDRLNPLFAEIRLQRSALVRMMSALRLPDDAEAVVKDPKKQRAAQTMHTQRRQARASGRLRVVGEEI